MALSLISPAFAAHEPHDGPPTMDDIIGNPPAELGFLVQCEAIDFTLIHLYQQAAATLQVSALDNQREALDAKVADLVNQTRYMSKVAKEAVIPQITQHGVKEADVMAKAQEIMTNSLNDIGHTLGNPALQYEELAQMQSLLVQESNVCKLFTDKVMQFHTL